MPNMCRNKKINKYDFITLLRSNVTNISNYGTTIVIVLDSKVNIQFILFSLNKMRVNKIVAYFGDLQPQKNNIGKNCLHR